MRCERCHDPEFMGVEPTEVLGARLNLCGSCRRQLSLDPDSTPQERDLVQACLNVVLARRASGPNEQAAAAPVAPDGGAR